MIIETIVTTMDAHGTVKTVDDESALCSECRARFTHAVE